MSLIFPLQPFLRKSTPQRLVLKSSSKRFTVGGTLIFIALILFSMHLAAGPLFQTMVEQGTWVDRLIAYFFYGVLWAFPAVALLCWFYQESLILEKMNDGSFALDFRKTIGPIALVSNQFKVPGLQQLEVSNWIGSLNRAAIEGDVAPVEQKRYATRGHWMLKVAQDSRNLVLERRARREEIDWLKAIILNHFDAADS